MALTRWPAWAVCLALGAATVIATGQPAGAATRAAAHATESRGLLGHRGVPGGSPPQASTVTQPTPPVTAPFQPLAATRPINKNETQRLGSGGKEVNGIVEAAA